MKKTILETIWIFLFFTAMVLIIGSLTGCVEHIEATTETGEPLGYNRFQVVEGDYGCEAIVLDTETGVQYLWQHYGNAGGLTVLLDHDGKPLIAEGFKDY